MMAPMWMSSLITICLKQSNSIRMAWPKRKENRKAISPQIRYRIVPHLVAKNKTKRALLKIANQMYLNINRIMCLIMTTPTMAITRMMISPPATTTNYIVSASVRWDEKQEEIRKASNTVDLHTVDQTSVAREESSNEANDDKYVKN